MVADACADRSESDEQRDARISSVNRLAATMAHEFNNVLMGIQPFVDLIARGAEREQVEKALKHIALSIQRGKQITAEVLRMAHPVEPNLRSIAVGSWLRSMAIDIRAVLPRNVDLEVRVRDDEEQLYAACDVDQLNQVLMNLVANAKDAMSRGGKLTVSASRCQSRSTLPPATAIFADGLVQITVEDTGCGMDTGMLNTIFEPLFTTKRNGTGLGLAVVKQIIQRHGGTVSVESKPGVGTRFHLFLPAAPPAAFLDTASPADASQPVCPTGLRVLIVEDDRIVSTAIAQALRQREIHVDLLHTGGRAVEAVRRFKPDVVLLDVGLPDVPGSDLFWQLRRQFPSLPIVFSTAHADDTSLAGPLSERRVRFLRKPYPTETLLGALADVTQADDVPAPAC